MAALDVLPKDVAKRYLNIPASSTVDDVELVEDFIPPAVARVERHLGRALDAATVTASERLACRVVLDTYWRTQRARAGRGGASSSGAAIEVDSGPAGTAPITAKLVELLGDPAAGAGGVPPVPVGSFPAAESWPDGALTPSPWFGRWP